MGTGEFNAGGNPAMDKHPIQGGVEILLVASIHATETGISSGHLARMQTFYIKRPHLIIIKRPVSPEIIVSKLL